MGTIADDIDILEEDISYLDPALLKLLLQDKATKRNILWATDDYTDFGDDFKETDMITPSQITGFFRVAIQPRAAKSKAVRDMRIKKRAEVFTPSWICNLQNNSIDAAWFGRENVFNTPDGNSWKTTTGKIAFPTDDKNKTWHKYVDTKRLEITCGEAPYLVSRYDTTTGKLIPINERIGLLDRKLRIVNENAATDEEWLKWAQRAVESCYGYEFQGDSVLIARENLLYTYIDFYRERFKKNPSIKLLMKIANIVVWNIWQMDGLKCVVPYSCKDIETIKPATLFEKEQRIKTPCPACQKGGIYGHTGVYCKIYDWRHENSTPFISLIKEGK